MVYIWCWTNKHTTTTGTEIICHYDYYWLLMIVACLGSGKKRYPELQHVVEGIGSKMLSKELQELELNGWSHGAFSTQNP